MKSIVLTMVILCGLFSSAEAKKHPAPTAQTCFIFCDDMTPPAQRAYGVRSPGGLSGGIGPRPRQWCGWFMQKDTGITSRGTGLNLNMARSWARVGSASTAHVGAIVVWARGKRGGHVGRIVGRDAKTGGWIVRSGNDGRAVRERVRSVSNAIAIRSL